MHDRRQMRVVEVQRVRQRPVQEGGRRGTERLGGAQSGRSALRRCLLEIKCEIPARLEINRRHRNTDGIDDGPLHAKQAIRGKMAEIQVGGKRSEEPTSELQPLMRIPYTVFCL